MAAVVGVSLSPRPQCREARMLAVHSYGEQGCPLPPLASRSVMSHLQKRQGLGGRKRRNSDKPAAFACACEEQGTPVA